MTKPLLQLALDHTELDSALISIAQLSPYIDIIESGTVLCISEGIRAVHTLRHLYPQHILVADLKVADAAEILSEQAFKAGANWMTVMCAAPIATIAKAHEIADKQGREIQIELFGDWTMEQAKIWHQLGIRQVIYHRGRDAQASGQNWSNADLTRMQQLSDLGMDLSITGGLIAEDLHLFRHLSVKAFIVGRALTQVENPKQVAEQFHQVIDELWSKQ